MLERFPPIVAAWQAIGRSSKGTRPDVHHHYGTGHCSSGKATHAAVIVAALSGRGQITGYSSISSRFSCQAQQHLLSHRASDVVGFKVGRRFFLFQSRRALSQLHPGDRQYPMKPYRKSQSANRRELG